MGCHWFCLWDLLGKLLNQVGIHLIEKILHPNPIAWLLVHRLLLHERSSESSPNIDIRVWIGPEVLCLILNIWIWGISMNSRVVPNSLSLPRVLLCVGTSMDWLPSIATVTGLHVYFEVLELSKPI
ncbi:hypothetical protein, partial [Escherichia coli]|uniref:hypothetical protein n=1 Tax=Escherichia coli TaxID=562 RepID=UPI0032DB36FB